MKLNGAKLLIYFLITQLTANLIWLLFTVDPAITNLGPNDFPLFHLLCAALAVSGVIAHVWFAVDCIKRNWDKP